MQETGDVTVPVWLSGCEWPEDTEPEGQVQQERMCCMGGSI